CMQHKVLPLTF
nr:immunoglobulin light chain junction region [Macaca mulatta]MOX07754.1 immunoglobulin light chain junction region [Macaca mulatta]MOX07757.1 immunoglobulin light chain junction region [Macaca mulatta]MOX07804.1 immunoglobulin light chain junction region [Macaca mulatta]MOX07988.1 immunoglobulin light chain junction region [Macaca mulatta]